MSRKNQFVYLVSVTVLLGVAIAMMLTLFRVPSVAHTASTFNTEYTLVLSDYNGNAVHLYDYRRQVLIAYAWASWCPYCGTEIEGLAQLKATYGDNVQIVAINRGEPLSVARAYTNALTNTTGVVFLLDPTDSFFKDIGGYAMPEMVFIDSSGAIIFHQRGPIQMSDVQAEIEKLLHP
jgi:thiol-disulfide isomerase/thioredoxin